jgi:hypothetical protein
MNATLQQEAPDLSEQCCVCAAHVAMSCCIAKLLQICLAVSQSMPTLFTLCSD